MKFNETGSVQLQRLELEALLTAVDEDKASPWHGVHFNPRRSEAVATNGWLIVRAVALSLRPDVDPYTIAATKTRIALLHATRKVTIGPAGGLEGSVGFSLGAMEPTLGGFELLRQKFVDYDRHLPENTRKNLPRMFGIQAGTLAVLQAVSAAAKATTIMQYYAHSPAVPKGPQPMLICFDQPRDADTLWQIIVMSAIPRRDERPYCPFTNFLRRVEFPGDADVNEIEGMMDDLIDVHAPKPPARDPEDPVIVTESA